MTEPAQMSPGELLAYMGTNAAKWTDEFMRIQAKPETGPLDWGDMVGWFANALEAGRSAGMKATCPHSDVCELAHKISYCRTCGTVFDAAEVPE